MTTEMALTNKQRDSNPLWSRGRNGYFHARAVEVEQAWDGSHIIVRVWSVRRDGSPPILLRLVPADAHSLGEALLETISE